MEEVRDQEADPVSNHVAVHRGYHVDGRAQNGSVDLCTFSRVLDDSKISEVAHELGLDPKWSYIHILEYAQPVERFAVHAAWPQEVEREFCRGRFVPRDHLPLAAHAVEVGVPATVSDVTIGAPPGLGSMETCGFVSGVAVPVILDGRSSLILAAYDRRPNAFTEGHTQRLEHAAASVVHLLGRTQMDMRTHHELAVRGALAEIGRLAAGGYHVDDWALQFAKEAHRLLNFDRISVELFESESRSLVTLLVQGGCSDQDSAGRTFHVDSSVQEAALISGQSLILSKGQLDLRYSHAGQGTGFQDAGFCSIAVSPVWWSGQIVGVVTLCDRRDDLYAESDLAILERVASTISGAVHRARITSQLDRDLDLRSTLLEIARIFNHSRHVDHAFLESYAHIYHLIPSDLITLDQVDFVTRRIRRLFVIETDRVTARYSEFRPLGSLVQRVIEQREPVIQMKGDPCFDDDLVTSFKESADAPFNALLVVPIIMHGNPIAVISFRSMCPDAYDQSRAAVAESLASIISGSISWSLHFSMINRELLARSVGLRLASLPERMGSRSDLVRAIGTILREYIPFERIEFDGFHELECNQTVMFDKHGTELFANFDQKCPRPKIEYNGQFTACFDTGYVVGSSPFSHPRNVIVREDTSNHLWIGTSFSISDASTGLLWVHCLDDDRSRVDDWAMLLEAASIPLTSALVQSAQHDRAQIAQERLHAVRELAEIMIDPSSRSACDSIFVSALRARFSLRCALVALLEGATETSLREVAHDCPENSCPQHRREQAAEISAAFTASTVLWLEDGDTRVDIRTMHRSAPDTGRPQQVMAAPVAPKATLVLCMERQNQSGFITAATVAYASEWLRVLAMLHERQRTRQSPDINSARSSRRDAVEAPDRVLLSGLSDRDRRLLISLAQGHTNDEIAKMLHLSAGTVANHLVRIYRILGVSGRANAAAQAIKLGIL